MATPAEPPAKKRRTSAETRDEVVAAGIELLREHGPSAGLDRVTLADAIAQTDVARPSAYRAFGSDGGDPQTNFHNVMVLKLINQPYLGDPSELEAMITPIVELTLADEEATPDDMALTMRDLIRLLAADTMETLVNDMDAAVYFTALASTVAPNPVPGLINAITEAEQEAAASFNVIYRGLTAAFGLRPRPGWTVESVAAVVANHVMGFVIGAKVMPHTDIKQLPTGPNGELQDWTNLGVATVATIITLFEEDPRVKKSARLQRLLEDPRP